MCGEDQGGDERGLLRGGICTLLEDGVSESRNTKETEEFISAPPFVTPTATLVVSPDEPLDSVTTGVATTIQPQGHTHLDEDVLQLLDGEHVVLVDIALLEQLLRVSQGLGLQRATV